MTDDRMDARLRAAGERWRTANTATAQAEPSPPETIAGAAPVTGRRRRRPWTLLASAAVVAAALVAGGVFFLRDTNGSRPSGDATGLVGPVWRLTGQGGNGSGILHIDRDGNLVADDECVVLGGKAKTTEHAITVTDQVVRYKSCVDQYGPRFSGAGTAVLNGTSRYVIDAKGLTITKDARSLHLALAPATTPAPTLDVPTFVGAHWQLVAAQDATGAAVRIAGKPILHVADDGTLTANDGCNQLTGKVAARAGSRPRFQNVGGTEIGCLGDSAATAAVVDKVLDGTVQQQVVKGRLTVTKNGAGTLTYRWVPTDSEATDPAKLTGTTWHLQSVALSPAVAASTLQINGSHFGVGGDCGGPGGDVVVHSGTMILSNGVTATPTYPKCTRARSDQATTVDNLLTGELLWSVRDGKLIINQGGPQSDSLVFASKSATPPSSNPDAALTGHAWVLLGVAHKGAKSTSSNGGVPSVRITFDGHGAFQLVRRCGTDAGDVTIGSATATFANLHNVREYKCPYAATDRALPTVLAVFHGVTSWSVGTNSMTITKGSTELRFASPGASASPTTSGPTTLSGTWSLTGIENSSGNSDSGTGSSDLGITLDMRAKTFAIHGLCAVRSGVYASANDHAIQVKPADSTAACGDLGSSAKNAITRVLLQTPGVVAWSIRGSELTLTRGGTAITFEKR